MTVSLMPRVPHPERHADGYLVFKATRRWPTRQRGKWAFVGSVNARDHDEALSFATRSGTYMVVHAAHGYTTEYEYVPPSKRTR